MYVWIGNFTTNWKSVYYAVSLGNQSCKCNDPSETQTLPWGMFNNFKTSDSKISNGCILIQNGMQCRAKCASSIINAVRWRRRTWISVIVLSLFPIGSTVSGDNKAAVLEDSMISDFRKASNVTILPCKNCWNYFYVRFVQIFIFHSCYFAMKIT